MTISGGSVDIGYCRVALLLLLALLLLQKLLSLGTVDRAGPLEAIQGKDGIDTLGLANGRALFGQVIGEAVDASLGEILTAGLAPELITVAVILQFRTAVEVLEDHIIRLATHPRQFGLGLASNWPPEE